MRFFNEMDAHLARHPFVAGPRYSIADITALVTVDFARWAKLSIPDECSHLRRWHAEVSSRPERQSLIAREFVYFALQQSNASAD